MKSSHNFEVVKSRGTWVKPSGMKNRNPFTQRVVQQATYVRLQYHIAYICLHIFGLISFTNFNAQFLYSITICMLHYNPRYVSSINMPNFRRTNCIIIASGIVTLCSPLSSAILYSRLQRVTIPDAVIIKFVLLKMGMLLLETCPGL